jgi:hypothetical protein
VVFSIIGIVFVFIILVMTFDNSNKIVNIYQKYELTAVEKPAIIEKVEPKQ